MFAFITSGLSFVMQFPWAELIARRERVFGAAMEPELCRRCQEHFFKGMQ
jgi:hypothetical protein